MTEPVPIAVAAALVADLQAAGVIAPARYLGLVTSGPSRTEAADAVRGALTARRARRQEEDPQTGHAPRSRSITLPAFRNDGSSSFGGGRSASSGASLWRPSSSRCD